MRWILMGCSAKRLLLLVLVFHCTVVTVCSQNIGDPYKILGVHRKATLAEIRKAYKLLAKEWHPDKNEDPKAESRFVEIKQAYELLSDMERRQAYDNYGILNEDDALYRQRHDYSQYRRHMDPFDDIFNMRFESNQDVTFFHKLSVTTRHFENNILEKSIHTPALTLFYSDWCFECLRVADSWKKLVDALQPLGVTMATVNARHESQLVRKVGVHQLPCIVFLVDKQMFIYKDNINSIPKVLEFMRSKFPYRLVRSINDDNIKTFITNYEDNKVKALVFEERNTMRLRYMIVAYHYRKRVAFGFVDMTSSNSMSVIERYNIEHNIDTVILLNEEYDKPVASISMSEVSTQSLHQLIQPNQFLMIPRLSSQSVLEGVCPWGRKGVLCCVLIGKTQQSLHTAAALLRIHTRKISFTYVYTHTQPNFLKALAPGAGDNEAIVDESRLHHRIVLIWRHEPHVVNYQWLNETWPDCGDICDQSRLTHDYHKRLNKTRDELIRLLSHVRHSDQLPYRAHVQELIEENTPKWYENWWSWIESGVDRTLNTLHKEHTISIISVLGTVVFIVAAGYFMAYLVRIEEEQVRKKKDELKHMHGMKQNNNEPTNIIGSNNMSYSVTQHQTELRLHELRAEKYNGLVRLLKPGCRTIVLLVDIQSRDQLIAKFHKACWPYRKNKTLMFAYLMVERNLEWFRQLIQLSLHCSEELHINARNAVGTVLSLNGHRKYFCIFHAKHPESKQPNKRMNKMTRSLANIKVDDPEAGAFIGFESEPDSSDEDDTGPKVLLQENLLDGLSNWLDRLFEGSTHRLYINYWPDMTTK